MKNLKINFTTPEQSKQLLELGVPAESADCYYYDWASDPEDETYGACIQWIDTTIGDNYQKFRDLEIAALPCWSVGRLIDISMTCTTLPDEEWMFPFWKDVQDNVEWAIKVIESAVRTEHIDFSKLN